MATIKPRPISIGGRRVGPGNPVYIVAEAGVNHNGSLRRGREMVDVADRAGADAVKFQAFNADELATPRAMTAKYQRARGSRSPTQRALLSKLALSDDDFRALKRHCDGRGLDFLATPFDDHHVGLLEELDVPAFKVASGDLTNIPLLVRVSRTGRPVILSTGMGNLQEIDESVATVRALQTPIALLHCVSSYPAPHKGLRLRAIGTLRRRYSVPVGFSDHTLGPEAAVAATALGACIIEKHFTLDRSLSGPDHAISMGQRELGALVRAIRNVEAALEGADIGPTESELESMALGRRSIVLRHTLRQGERVREEDLVVSRPGMGLKPRFWNSILGRRAARDISAFEPLSLDMFE